MIGLGLAASGHFPYAVKYSGAMVVANFNFAILMRNEIFGRLLYLFVNTCFAKVCLIFGLVCPFAYTTFHAIVGTSQIQIGMHLGASASRWYPLGLCNIWYRLVDPQDSQNLSESC